MFAAVGIPLHGLTEGRHELVLTLGLRPDLIAAAVALATESNTNSSESSAGVDDGGEVTVSGGGVCASRALWHLTPQRVVFFTGAPESLDDQPGNEGPIDSDASRESSSSGTANQGGVIPSAAMAPSATTAPSARYLQQSAQSLCGYYSRAISLSISAISSQTY